MRRCVPVLIVSLINFFLKWSIHIECSLKMELTQRKFEWPLVTRCCISHTDWKCIVFAFFKWLLISLTPLPLHTLIYIVYSVCLSVVAGVLMCIGMLEVLEPVNQFSLDQHRTSASLATGICLHGNFSPISPCRHLFISPLMPRCGRRPPPFPQSERLETFKGI